MRAITITRYLGPVAATIALSLITLALLMVRRHIEPQVQLLGYAPLLVALIAIGFVAVIVVLLSRLAEAENRDAAHAAETDHILASVNEGLFLIDKNHIIGRQKSARVNEILGETVDVSGNFFELLFNLSPQTDIKLAREYLDLLMAGRVKQKLMRDVNPLHEVPIEVRQPNGSLAKKFLHIEFTRDETEEADSSDARALVSITDVTREVQLRAELEQSREQEKERLNLLMSVVQVSNDSLQQFFDNTEKALIEINEVLAQEGAGHEENVKKLEQIATKVHRLKGDASALNLGFFETAFHNFEESVTMVRRNMFIDGRDMTALAVQLKDILSELENVKSITPQLRAVGATQAKPVDTPVSDIPERLLQVAKRAADNLGKHVDVACSGFEILAEQPALARKIDSMAIQLVRNSVVHGIESPAERLEKNKSPLGMVRVNFELGEKGYKLSVLDDGRGLDFDRIEKKVVEQMGFNAEQAKKLDRGKLLHYIFQPGFTSLDEASVDAGRGVGLTLVRDEANNLGGRIGIKSTAEKFCQFAVTIPADRAVKTSPITSRAEPVS